MCRRKKPGWKTSSLKSISVRWQRRVPHHESNATNLTVHHSKGSHEASAHGTLRLHGATDCAREAEATLNTAVAAFSRASNTQAVEHAHELSRFEARLATSRATQKGQADQLKGLNAEVAKLARKVDELTMCFVCLERPRCTFVTCAIPCLAKAPPAVLDLHPL